MDRLVTKNFTWVNIQRAGKNDIEELKTIHDFHELNLEDLLSSVQRPKIDSQKGYIFIVLHFPKYFKDIKKMASSEINIFLGNDFLVTSSTNPLKPLNNFFNKAKEDPKIIEEFIQNGPAMLLYEIIDMLFMYCFPILDKISERLSLVDEQMFIEKPSVIVSELAKLNQEIIVFRRMISPERGVIKDLEDKIRPFLAKDNDLYFDDITDSIEKIWNTLENLKEVTESLQRTHDSFVTYRLNEVMRILTVFSAIMLPLTVVTGFYGMNITGLPFADHIFAVEIITISMVALVIGMLIYFYKNKIL